MARNENGKGFSLKDHLFNEKKVQYLAELFAKADRKFDADSFTKKVMTKLTKLELKERIVWIAECLEEQLPKEFDAAAKIVTKALPAPLDPTKTDDDFGDFIFAPLGEYVVRNGLSEKYLSVSLKTLQEITQRFSMEDAIRYFLNEFETETMAELSKWASHRNYHVRRLVSEGTRPLLPWSGRIKLALEAAVPLLSELYFDPTRYVTRSVANHMNDIAKKKPELALKTLKQWQREGKQAPKEMLWIISHSLRTLVKQGNAEALALLGYHQNPKISVTNLAVNRKVIVLGESLEFSFTLTPKETGNLMVDYVIDFQKAGGKTLPRVFKLKKLAIEPGETVTVRKKHPFMKDSSTLKFYPGKHTVILQINGKQFGSVDFDLKM